ncbi:citrate/2-methylcitrate synthase [Myxococcus vastator]|uniref:citrate/2-methylcitrate synthase n=1 Tax=Myxococcus vastator TaxID=2709664 RepID=UPI0023DDF28A|nr:citrate/2-methylcitrate synthase [Myxococcus vastator]
MGRSGSTPPLVEAALSVRPEAVGVRVTKTLLEVLKDAGHPPPAVDFGLAMLAQALGLPPGAGATLFAIGRAAGWVEHVLEQREQRHLLRPRGRYVEPAPTPRGTVSGWSPRRDECSPVGMTP